MGSGGRHDAPTLHLLGTIHRAHLQTRDHSLGHVKAAFDAVRPGLLLVEIEPQELARGNLAAGPFEMVYLAVTARREGVPVEGIDWIGAALAPPPSDAAITDALEAELRTLDLRWPPSYAEAHLEDYVRRTQRVHEIRVRYVGDAGDGEWMRRNLWMAERVRRAVARHAAVCVLLAVGVEHLGILRDLLSRPPALACRLAPAVAAYPPEAYQAPPDVLAAWVAGLSVLQERIAALPLDDPMRTRLVEKQTYYRIAIEHKGIARPNPSSAGGD